MSVDKLSPVIMGAIEKKIVEAALRLQEAHRILNYLKSSAGYEYTPFESLLPAEHAPEQNPEPEDCEA